MSFHVMSCQDHRHAFCLVVSPQCNRLHLALIFLSEMRTYALSGTYNNNAYNKALYKVIAFTLLLLYVILKMLIMSN